MGYSIFTNEQTKPLTNEELKRVFKRLSELDESSVQYEDLVNYIIIKNIRLVKLFSNGLYDKNKLEEDDLVLIGMTALKKAIKRYDYTKGVSFSSYARPWIIMELRRKSYEYVLGDSVVKRDYEMLKKYYSASIKLMQEYNREVNEDEIISYLKLNDKQIKHLKNLLNLSNPSSLDKKINEDDDLTYMDIIPANKTSTNYFEVVNKILQDKTSTNVFLDKALYNLTYDEIASNYNLDIREVKNIYNDAIKKLKTEEFYNNLMYKE